MLYFITKTRRNWNGGLYAVSYYNEVHDSFGAKHFGAKMEFEDAKSQCDYIKKTYSNPFITIDMKEADDTLYVVPPEKIISVWDKTYEEKYD